MSTENATAEQMRHATQLDRDAEAAPAITKKRDSGRDLDPRIPVDTLPPLNEPPTELFSHGLTTGFPLLLTEEVKD